MNIYRATDETTARAMSCWAIDECHAGAYACNPGKGGGSLLTATIETDSLSVLDLRGERDCDAIGRFGLDTDSYTYVYECWEADPSIISGYDVVIYDDDYPEHCETVLLVSQAACDHVSIISAETWSEDDRRRARAIYSSRPIWEIIEELDEELDEEEIE